MKTILKIIGALFALIVIAALVIPMFISADLLKKQAAAQISKATGRTLTIDGNASLTLFPDIALRLEKVTLGNPQGTFAAPHFFTAQAIAVGVKLMPLLHRQVDVTGVTLEGADIALEQNAAGAKNWDFSTGAATEKASATEAKTDTKFAASPTPVIGTIRVIQSNLSYAVAGKPPVALKDIDVTLEGADGRGALKLDAAANYKEKKIALNLAVDKAKALMAGEESAVKLTAMLPGGSVTFDGVASKAPAAKGDIAVQVSDLPALLSWATGKPAAPATPQRLQLASPMTFADKKLTLSALKLDADSLHANAKFSVDTAGAVPSVKGEIQLGAVDTSAFSKGSAKAEDTKNAAAAPQEGWDATPIDLSALRAVNAALGITIESVKAGNLTLGATVMKLNLLDGALKLGVEKMALYGGNAVGDVALSPSGFSTAMQITGVQIEPLMTAMSGTSRLKGTAEVKLNLRAQGNSQRAYVQSLNGTTSLSVKDGAVKGINVAKFLRNAQKGFLADAADASTDFSALSMSMNFVNGVGSTHDVSMLSPLLRLAGEGTLSLPPKTLNMRFTPRIVADAAGQGGKDSAGIAVPFVVAGSWSNPSITPDLVGAAQEALKNPQAIKDTINQSLKNIKGGIKQLNSPQDLLNVLGGSKNP